jgi:hypothetical protein
MSDANIENATEAVDEFVHDHPDAKAITDIVTKALEAAGFTNPAQIMAGQRPPISLAALSEQVSEAVGYNIADFLDEEEITNAVLGLIYGDDYDCLWRLLE